MSPAVRRPWRPPTLDDVARQAQVSLATASRALSAARNHQPSSVARGQEIIETAQRFGYCGPTPPATRRLLALTTDTSRTGYWLTLTGIFEVARRMQLELSIHMIPSTREERLAMLATALQPQVDGVVVLEFDWPGVAILDDLPVDLPVAVAGGDPSVLHTPTDPPRAWIDDFGGARTATQHLIDLGHRHIAYVGVPPAGHPDPREAGWRQALTAAGLPVQPMAATGWSIETGIRAAGRLLDSDATAALCGNDDLALGVMAGLARAGHRVPDDMSVIGMDDHPHALAAVPALTTVRLDFERLGRVAAQLSLDVHPAVTNASHIEIPAKLVVRGTTAPPPG